MIFGTTDLCLDNDHLSCEKIWTHTPSASGSYSRLANEIWVDIKIFKIFYRLNYLDFYFVNVYCNVINNVKSTFWLFSNKAYFMVCFEVRKLWLPIFTLIPTIKY